ncbi:MAG: phosphatase PAP2 family protein [Gemmatimonadetes bacterium]|nr:phosphatase PAP2 family protein [Gemmatimonadota bacterium]
MLSLPITSVSSTFLIQDYVGSRDFLYGFGLNAAVTEGLKRALQRERPDGSDEKSFPSGHTSISFQSASFIHFRYGLRYAVPAYAAAAFVGYSRVYADAHFVKDVVAGLALGVISSGIFTEKRSEESRGPDGDLGMALHLRFGGGLGTSWSMGFAEVGR